MKMKTTSSSLLLDRTTFIRPVSPCIRHRHPLHFTLDQRRLLSRIPPTPKQVNRLAQARLDWEREKRHSLRTLLIQQYEEEERPRWSKTAKRLVTDDVREHGDGGYWTSSNSFGFRGQRQRHEEVQCGIFWDIENVRNETHPPAVVIEAIRDFAGCRHTPVFQAYMSRPPLNVESRIHAIYSQLGVTFIQCYGLGKDTADKKIISDMWKFYASYQRSSPDARVRIILITGDRDFADAIGQLRNLGVEIGILTGSVLNTAPVYDDYTLGMRVLPLLGVIEARARDIDLNVYQASKRLSLTEFEEKMNEDFVDESSVNAKGTPVEELQPLDESKEATPAQAAVEANETAPASPKVPDPVPRQDVTSRAINSTQTNNFKEQQTMATSSPTQQVQEKAADTTQTAKPEETSPEHATSRLQPAVSFEAVSGTPPVVIKESTSEENIASRASKKTSKLLDSVQSFFSRFTTTKEKSSTLSPPPDQETSSPDMTTTNAAAEPTTPSPSKDTTKPTPSPSSPKSHLSRPLNDPVPLQSSLFSASNLRTPSLSHLISTTPTAATTANNILSRIPWTTTLASPSITDLSSYYRTQVLRFRPAGIDEKDMRRLWDAWMRLESWGNEEVSETVVRRCARMALSKAAEIVEVRREEKERREEEKRAAMEKERSVIEGALGGKEKVWYPLTQEVKDLSAEEEEGTKEVEEVIQQLESTGSTTTLVTAPMPGKLTDLETPKVEVPDKKLMSDEKHIAVLAELNKIAEHNQPLPEVRERWLVDIKKPLTPQLPPPTQPRDYSHRV